MLFNRKVKGFSLTEMLFVIIIIGILVLIALPNQSNVISKAKAVEAKMQLAHLHSLEKAHFWANSKYSNNIEEISFEQETLVTDGVVAYYVIQIIEASPTGFIARAT